MSYTDEYGDRMKAYEGIETSRKLDKTLPIYARIDGRSFHSFTRGLDRPYDPRLLSAMNTATKTLIAKTHAKIGYVQSDEISLIWAPCEEETEPLFGGKVHKLTSVLASLATASFINEIHNSWYSIGDEYIERLPHFDCRVMNLPSKSEAANMLLWRAMDAKKNAISMAAQYHFSHNELKGADQKTMLSMLHYKGVVFEYQYPWPFREGRFYRRDKVARYLTQEELEKIPHEHHPIGKVERNEILSVAMPPFNEVKNRIEVIFDGAEPVT